MQNLSGLLLPIALFAFLYLFMIRPQQQQQKKRKAMLESVQKGDQVVTIGGIHGTVQTIDPDTVRLEIAPNVSIVISRSAVGNVSGKK